MKKLAAYIKGSDEVPKLRPTIPIHGTLASQMPGGNAFQPNASNESMPHAVSIEPITNFSMPEHQFGMDISKITEPEPTRSNTEEDAT